MNKKAKKELVKINKILNEFLEQFDLTARYGEEFAYYYTKNEVTYALEVLSEAGEHFLEYCQQIFDKNIPDNIFMISILHEVGHHHTLDEVDDYEYNYCNLVKASLTEFSKENNFIYFDLPVERIATEWGLNYMTDHIEEMRELWTSLQPHMLNFYAAQNLI